MRQWATVVAVALVVLGGCAGIVGLPGQGAGPDGGDDERLAFEEMASEAGFAYRTNGSDIGNGDGAVLATDFDRDGDTDLLAVGGGPTMFENVGDGFERAGVVPKVPEAVKLNSGLFFDYDNDGWEDLLLVGVDQRPVFLENDRGTFRVRDVGLDAPPGWPTTATAADFDGDGCLDLFVARTGDWRTHLPRRSIGGPVDETNDNGGRNLLYRGTCGGTFERVNGSGIGGNHWSLAASAADLTGDGKPDIHVANDFYSDVVYVNRGNGTFAFEKRVVPDTNRNGMASDVEDVNGDGRMDLFVTNVGFAEAEDVWVLHNGIDVVNGGNNLLLNRGNGTFVDRADEYGVRIGGWGWSGNLVDLTNDGHLDLIHATGDYARRGSEGHLHQVSEPPRLWVGNGSGFERVNASRAGLVPTDGRGLAALDYDGDGDVDLAVSNTVGPFRLYRNTLDEAAGNYTEIRLLGTADQTPIGSRVYVTAGGETTAKAYTSKVNYFSQNPRTLHVGVGDAAVVERVRVVFPDGTERVVTDVPVDRELVVALNGTTTVREAG